MNDHDEQSLAVCHYQSALLNSPELNYPSHCHMVWLENLFHVFNIACWILIWLLYFEHSIVYLWTLFTALYYIPLTKVWAFTQLLSYRTNSSTMARWLAFVAKWMGYNSSVYCITQRNSRWNNLGVDIRVRWCRWILTHKWDGLIIEADNVCCKFTEKLQQ